MNDGLRHSGLPLGGLGTGSVELRRDGSLHEWQIMNNFPWGSGPEPNMRAGSACVSYHEAGAHYGASYFGLQVHGPGGPRSAVLGVTPAYHVHLNDPYHLPWLERPESVDAQMRMPFARLRYRFESFPVEVELEAFSPFIPLNAKDSGLPLAFFTFRLRNRTGRPLSVSLFNATRNVVGYAEPERESEIGFRRGNGSARLGFRRKGLPARSTSDGSLVVGAFGGRGRATWAAHLRGVRDIWDPLRAEGRLENRDYGDFAGALGNVGAEQAARLRRGMPCGVVCVERALPPRGAATVTFVLAWHFPNLWESDYAPRGRKGACIGHRYAEWFADADAVFDYGRRHFERLRLGSLAFVDAFYRSTLPPWLLGAINAQLTTLVKSSWWDRRGRFGIWEGLGCCGLQTTDVSYYGSWPVLALFPELQKSQMRLTAAHVAGDGCVPHMMPGNFSCCDVDRLKRIDMAPQYVLMLWRDWLWTGDEAHARALWPSVRKALDYSARCDTDGDGLPNNKGPDQTYDQFPLKGTSSFVGFLYAGALRAAAELARRFGEKRYAEELEGRFGAAMTALQEQLWNGRYYRLSHDPADGADNEGVMLDQINGDGFVRQTTGAGLLPDGKVRSALSAILKHCRDPRGFLRNCAWPQGGGVAIGRHTSDQANCPWSGTEYALAAHLVWAGMERQGLSVARDVWERYERAGLRFNHIECGGHYHRALSAWALYMALAGVAVDRPRKGLRLRCGRTAARFVVTAPEGWGVVEADPRAGCVRLEVCAGSLSLRYLRVDGFAVKRPAVTVAGRRITARIDAQERGVRVTFPRTVRLLRGRRLELRAAKSR